MDNDPIVLAHERALMTSDPVGATAFIQADFREPGKIHADPAFLRTLDLDKPVTLMLIAILHFFTDDQDPQGIVSALIDVLPSGSYLTVTNLTADFMDPEQAAKAREAGQRRARRHRGRRGRRDGRRAHGRAGRGDQPEHRRADYPCRDRDHAGGPAAHRWAGTTVEAAGQRSRPGRR